MALILLFACTGSTFEPGQSFDDTQVEVDPDDQDGDGYLASEDDCDDANAQVNPGRSEACDGLDNDCNGQVDDDAVDATTWYVDADGDGYGVVTLTERACDAPGSGYSELSGDCDDELAHVNPDGVEVCDDLYTDEDCDGSADDADDDVDPAGFVTLYADTDGDGYGDASSSGQFCHEGGGWVLDDSDCDDTSAELTPENECDLGWYGTYTGDFSYSGELDFGGQLQSDTCSASGVTVSVDPLASAPNQVSSAFTCTWSGVLGAIIGPQTVNFEGEIHGDDSVTGGLFVGSLYVEEYAATLSGDADFDGAFAGTTTYSGFDIAYTGEFSFSR